MAVIAALFGALALFIQFANRQAAQQPRLPAFVVDEAGILSSPAQRAMEADLRMLDAEGGAQIVVLTIPTLDGAPIENIAIERARRWRIGRADKNNGVLLLIAYKESRARIEVGYGLEGVLTDARARLIVENDILPALRSGDASAAARKGLDAILAAVHPAPLRQPDLSTPERMGAGWLIGVGVFVALAFLIVVGVVQAVLLSSETIRNRIAASQRWGWFARIRILGSASPGEGGGGSSGSSGGPSGGGGSFGGGGANN